MRRMFSEKQIKGLAVSGVNESLEQKDPFMQFGYIYLEVDLSNVDENNKLIIDTPDAEKLLDLFETGEINNVPVYVKDSISNLAGFLTGGLSVKFIGNTYIILGDTPEAFAGELITIIYMQDGADKYLLVYYQEI